MDILDDRSLDNEKPQGGIPDELAKNYREMDEMGKEKLLKKTEKILELHNQERPHPSISFAEGHIQRC
jgi:hypothetical protein